MVRIEAGGFVMGSPPDEPGRESAEGVRHPVVLTRPFLLGATPVTVAEFQPFLERSPELQAVFRNASVPLNEPNLPIVNVSWFDAVNYANWLSTSEGITPCYVWQKGQVQWTRPCRGYRLPSEAEWEYAARAGTTGPFPVDGVKHLDCDFDPQLASIAWTCANGGKRLPAVGLKLPNPWGLHDMHGLVWEWVWDWDGEDPGPERQVDPIGPPEPLDDELGPVRVDRGGSYLVAAEEARSAMRGGLQPEGRTLGMGFRIARTLVDSPALDPTTVAVDVPKEVRPAFPKLGPGVTLKNDGSVEGRGDVEDIAFRIGSTPTGLLITFNIRSQGKLQMLLRGPAGLVKSEAVSASATWRLSASQMAEGDYLLELTGIDEGGVDYQLTLEAEPVPR